MKRIYLYLAAMLIACASAKQLCPIAESSAIELYTNYTRTWALARSP